MKTIFKTLGLGALFAALMAVGGVTVLAQDACNDLDAINALDAKIRADYPKMETRKAAVDEGKQYLEKYGACDVTKDFSAWLKGRIPVWEKDLKQQDIDADQKALHAKFDAGFTSKNYDDSFAAADQYLSKYPDDPSNISLIVTLGLLGPQQTASKNTKYNANSEKYAKMAIERLKSGNTVAKKNGKYGFQIECESKDECISGLTFGIAYMNYYGNNNKQAALPYYYELTKIPGSYKSNPYVYGTIGDYYYDTVLKLKDEAIKLQDDTKAFAKNAPPADAPDDVKKKFEADVDAKIAAVNAKSAMLNGYLERDMDAYSRAYSLAKNSTQDKQYGDTLYKRLQALYNARFQKQDGLDTWISSAVAKPFPDPTSAVTPVSDTTSSGESSVGPTTAKPVTATPVSTPIKPVSTSTKPAGKVGASKTASPSDAVTAKTAGKGAVKH